MSPLLSVIIPVCNGSHFIRKTVKRLLQQDYSNFELIIVENGSHDNTFDICNKLKQSDRRCVVYQNIEKSILLARKTGIENAHGDYITFCDADDYYFDLHAFSNMVKEIENTRADIVQFGYFVNRYGFKQRISKIKKTFILSRQELMEEEIGGVMGGYNQNINTNVWSKIYRSDVLKKVLPELNVALTYAEDMYLNCCAFFCEKTRKIALVPDCYYVYNSGIGITGDGIVSGEKTFFAYTIVKPKALELASKNGAGNRGVYLCHRESLRYLDVLIQAYIERGDSEKFICEKISQYWTYNFIKMGRDYFIDYATKSELDEEMYIFATENDPHRYYDYCISRMGNINKRRFFQKVKSIVKMIRIGQMKKKR